MYLRAIDLREIRLRLRRPFVSSRGTIEERRVLLVRVEDENGLAGWGECTSLEAPFYTEEWIDGSWIVLRDYLAPLAVGVEIRHPDDVPNLLSGVRGHMMAKGSIENAIWHLLAERRRVPLSKLLGGTRTVVEAAVAIGLESSREELHEAIAREVSANYRRIKLKIEPGQDIQMLEEVRTRFPDAPLSVDANGVYQMADIAVLRKLDRFGLSMIEQPFAPDDLAAHATLQNEMRTPVCLDESIVSPAGAAIAIDMRACRVINVKSGRVGGHGAAMEIERMCRDLSVPVWCGGMIESGIGRAHNIALASLEGFVLPAEVSSSSRYWERDIVYPPVTARPDGTVRVPDEPGLGFEVDVERIERMTSRFESIRP